MNNFETIDPTKIRAGDRIEDGDRFREAIGRWIFGQKCIVYFRDSYGEKLVLFNDYWPVKRWAEVRDGV